MSSSHYVQVPYPWKASVDVREEGPSRFYAHLVSQALRYGLPTRRRFGALLGAVGRAGIPAGPVAAALRALPRRERPDVDALLDEVGASWGELAARSERLPRAVGALSALALQRKIGLTVFVFAGGDAPLVVCKVPEPGDDRVEAEARALDEAAPAGVAPRHLGRVGAAVVQEALDGHALRVEPVDPDSAAAARWSDEHQQLADGLERLAEVTHKQQPVGELAGPLERALAEHSLGSSARRALEGAAADVARVGSSVLRHGDTSAQNCLFRDGNFIGLVDWELAQPRGAPGADVLNAALAFLEHGIGLRRWSESRALVCFREAWGRAPLFEEARASARRACKQVGIAETTAASFEIAFFGRRLGRRLANPDGYATGPATAARMLEYVCAH